MYLYLDGRDKSIRLEGADCDMSSLLQLYGGRRSRATAIISYHTFPPPILFFPDVRHLLDEMNSSVHWYLADEGNDPRSRGGRGGGVRLYRS